jgi:D-ribose pyranose/furanose isomerase RbsD
MAASKNTVTDVYMVMQRHLPLPLRTKVISDLALVKGNASFTRTVTMLAELHQRLLADVARDDAAHEQSMRRQHGSTG